MERFLTRVVLSRLDGIHTQKANSLDRETKSEEVTFINVLAMFDEGQVTAFCDKLDRIILSIAIVETFTAERNQNLMIG